MMSLKSNTYNLTDFRDPFSVDAIEKVYITSYKNFGKITHYGLVEFRNGSTKGEQRFDGDSFADVGNKIQAFINELGENK